MKIEPDAPSSRPIAELSSRFCQRLQTAVAEVRERLLARYLESRPEQGATIREVLAEAEFRAWRTPFPHLFFPDLAQARLTAALAPVTHAPRVRPLPSFR